MDPNRLLHKDSSHGYTNRLDMAMPAEPEAVSESVQVEFSVRARTQFAEERQEENARRDNQQWLERLKRAEMEASSKGVDIFRPQATIRSQILAIEQAVSGRGTFAAA